MTKLEFEFGYYPYMLEITTGSIVISTLDDLQKTIEEIKSDPNIDKDWLYSGPQLVRNLGGTITKKPYNARIFSMPKTHLFSHSNADNEEHINFHIWGLSFILGTQLSLTEAGFLDAVSLRPGQLTDFKIAYPNVEKAVSLIDQFWITHSKNKKITKRICATLNSLYMSQYPHHLDFEEFNLLYMSLDTCSAITRELHTPSKKHVTHAERIDDMCQIYGIVTPDWAKPQSNKSEISIIRNDTLHEAIFFGEPLGYAIYDNQATGKQYRNVLLEMRALVCRLLVAILFGVNSNYIKSATGTRMKFRLEI